MIKKFLVVIIIFIVIIINGCSNKSFDTTLHLAIPMNGSIQNTETNFYVKWLEQKVGAKIEINFINENYTEEYLRLLLTSDSNNIDLVFFNSEIDLRKNIEYYGKKGLILPLDNLIDKYGYNTKLMLESFTEYNLSKFIKAEDGKMYYSPLLHMSRITENAQALWLNTGWLESIDLTIPKTTEDFYNVLSAFKNNDPNKNEIYDEVPVISSGSDYSKQVINFLINSFVYNDPINARMAVNNGKVFFAPITDQWREAMIYLNKLYMDDLLPEQNFTYTNWQLTQLASDPRSVVGGFTAHNITDVLTSGSAELISNFTFVPPLTGPNGKNYATVYTPIPYIGGIIPSSSKNSNLAFKLMDTMLSIEASLIGYYGEPGVDWEFGKQGDLDILGSNAKIHIKFSLYEKQNKTLLNQGPAYLPAEYIDNVTWSGFQADQKYTGARAASTYFPYMPKEYIKLIDFHNDSLLNDLKIKIENFTDESIIKFIKGEINPNDDNAWIKYVKHFNTLSLEKFIKGVQNSYDSIKKK